MKRQFPIHPPFFAAFPVLSLYSANLALVPLADLWRPLGITMLGSGVLWLIGTGLFRDWRRGAALATAITAALFLYGRIVVAGYSADDTAARLQIGAWFVLSVGIAWLLVRRFKRGDWQTPALNVIGVALVISSGASIFFGFAAARRHIAQLSTQAESSQGASSANLPDIVYIILDGYGRSDQLKRVFGYDNSAFVKGLEDRGFYVAKASHSNFVQTELSLSSSLNIDTVQNLLPKMGPNEIDRSPLDQLVNDSAVSRHLKAKGYKYIAITSGFPSFQMKAADLWFHAPLRTTLFEQAVLQETPFNLNSSMTGSMFVQRRADVLGAFENLMNQANQSSEPRFILVHLLLPHPPFVFAADGSEQRWERMFGYWDGSHYYDFGGNKDEYRRGYVGQLTFLDAKIMPVIDRILAQGQPRPIVIIQGDHGSKLGLNQDKVDKTDLNECLSNLNAFFVPPDIRQKLYPSITPVNSFRLVFDGLFGENHPLLPDRSWYSGNETPYKMIDVTDRLDKGPPP